MLSYYRLSIRETLDSIDARGIGYMLLGVSDENRMRLSKQMEARVCDRRVNFP